MNCQILCATNLSVVCTALEERVGEEIAQRSLFGRIARRVFPDSGRMKTFKPYTPNQLLFLPPALQDWLPEGHLALFISDVVDQALALTPIVPECASPTDCSF
jgi:hypothetical protein